MTGSLAFGGVDFPNLFVRNMPRISVDIDLTYLPIEDRSTTLTHINEALERIKSQIAKTIKGSHIVHNNTGKLFYFFESYKGEVGSESCWAWYIICANQEAPM